jgi:hypothetical protein
MRGNHVPAKLIADPQGPLEVYAISALPVADRRDFQRLRRSVDVKPRSAILDASADHRHAHAVAGDRRSINDRCAIIAAANREPMVQALRPRHDREHLTDVGDNSSEH